MARIFTGAGTQIFKYKDSGLTAAIEEAAAYIQERRKVGVEFGPDDVYFEQPDNLYVFTFPLERD